MSDASTLLTEVEELRRRTRADRDVHWFPLAVFGLLVLAAVPAYQIVFFQMEGAPPDALYQLEINAAADRYWLAALPVGALLTLWWYRRHGARIGLDGPVGRAVAAAVLAVAGYSALTLVPTLPGRLPAVFWIEIRGFAALLVVAVLLLALAVLERDALLGGIAVCYATVAATANFYHLENLFPYPGERWATLPSLLVPASVLLVGAGIVAVRAAVGRRRAR